MTKRRWFAAGIVTLFPLVAAAAVPATFDAAVQELGRYWLADNAGVGLTIAVYDDGQKHFYNLGTSRQDGNRLPTKDTVYEIGSVAKTMAGQLLARALGGQALNEEERRLYESHPEVAGKLLGTIPRLEAVAAMVAGQMQVPSRDLASGNPATWEPEKIGAAILWAAVQFDRHVSQGRIPEQAAQLVNQAAPGLPPAMTQAMVKALSDDSGLVMSRSVTMRDLEIGMTIEADVMSQRGARLVPRGTEVTSTVLERLRAVAGGIGLVEPIRVSVKVLD